MLVGYKIGRRVVELDTLTESLLACSACQVPMNLLNTVESRDFGQACVLDIQFSNCGAVNNAATGRKHGRVYDMNTKLALGKTFLYFWYIGALYHDLLSKLLILLNTFRYW